MKKIELNYEKIRVKFLKKFNELISNYDINVLPQLNDMPFKSCDQICMWSNAKTHKRLMLHEEKYEGGIDFACWFSKGGENYEIEELGISVIDTLKNINSILFLFVKWFIDDIPTDEMKELVKNYTKKK